MGEHRKYITRARLQLAGGSPGTARLPRPTPPPLWQSVTQNEYM